MTAQMPKDFRPAWMASQKTCGSLRSCSRRGQSVSKHPAQIVQMKVAPPPMTLPDTSRKQAQDVTQTVSTPELVHDTGDTPETPRSVDIARQPRLSPVGRIPAVVSKRDRDRRLPDNSFSRPFATGHASSDCPSARLALQSNPRPCESNQPSASTNRSSFDFYAGNDFITFAPRKDSDLTYSSSSSGNWNWMSSMPAHAQEDDIWNEYNDLMDDVMPEKTPLSAGSSLGAPFQYAGMLHDQRSPAMPAPLNVERQPSQQHQNEPPVSRQIGGARDSLAPPDQDCSHHAIASVTYGLQQSSKRWLSPNHKTMTASQAVLFHP
ncbi:hypothetical protein L1887_55540 [Cichorium endivia]|nr:hypothetical protein L1887_55540 [Cichorium endivia]